MTRSPIHQTLQWAVCHSVEKFFCGKYCWDKDDYVYWPTVPTFCTKKDCLRAIGKMRSFAEYAVPVRVSVTLMKLEAYK